MGHRNNYYRYNRRNRDCPVCRERMDTKFLLTKHHRKRKQDGGGDEPFNIIMVMKYQHEAWNTLFDRYPVEVIAQKLQNIWLPPGYEVIIRRRDGNAT